MTIIWGRRRLYFRGDSPLHNPKQTNNWIHMTPHPNNITIITLTTENNDCIALSFFLQISSVFIKIMYALVNQKCLLNNTTLIRNYIKYSITEIGWNVKARSQIKPNLSDNKSKLKKMCCRQCHLSCVLIKTQTPFSCVFVRFSIFLCLCLALYFPWATGISSYCPKL